MDGNNVGSSVSSRLGVVDGTSLGDTLGIEDGELGDELRSSHLPKIAHTKEAKIEINAPILCFMCYRRVLAKVQSATIGEKNCVGSDMQSATVVDVCRESPGSSSSRVVTE